jgi:DNA-binding protein
MLPLASIDRIVRKAGIERISSDSIEELSGMVEDLGCELALEAAQVARHAKRKTILRKDIRFVAGKT